MGTNYYLVPDVCSHCGRGSERMHIGKSSAGWCFALHVDEEAGIRGLTDWQALWSRPDARIVDEYGDIVPPDEMLRKITQREWKGSSIHLSRHRVDGRHCTGHGDGTYDLLPGEFS